MVNQESFPHDQTRSFKNEQNEASDTQELQLNGLALDNLKQFEEALLSKGILHKRGNFNPIWFLAEMERNVYLWRTGNSIQDSDDFTFWVQPRKLISKRLHQLESSDSENPFINSLWSIGSLDPSEIERERRYLIDFLELYEASSNHLEALSTVSELVSTLIKKSNDNHKKKQIVSIPAFFSQH